MKKIQQIIILLAVLTFAAASNSAKAQELINSNIALGIYNNHDYIPQSAIDTVWGLTNIPKGYEVKSFTVSVMIKGFCQDSKSNSAKLTDHQRSIMSQVVTGGKIYIEDIKLVKISTDEIVSTQILSFFKDGVYAKGNYSPHFWDDYNSIDYFHPTIYAYPSLKSPEDDTTKYIVRSFRIEAVNPNYVFNIEIQGNQIDSATYSQLTKTYRYFYVEDIMCKEVATGKDVYAPRIKPENEAYFGSVCRSKEYFLKPNSKIDFFYQPNFKIDSVTVEYFGEQCRTYAYLKDWESYENCQQVIRFNGDVFPKDFKAFVKKLDSFECLLFHIYHDGKEEEVNVMIVE